MTSYISIIFATNAYLQFRGRVFIRIHILYLLPMKGDMLVNSWQLRQINSEKTPTEQNRRDLQNFVTCWLWIVPEHLQQRRQIADIQWELQQSCNYPLPSHITAATTEPLYQADSDVVGCRLSTELTVFTYSLSANNMYILHWANRMRKQENRLLDQGSDN